MPPNHFAIADERLLRRYFPAGNDLRCALGRLSRESFSGVESTITDRKSAL
ncbi:MAG: hypothetical protein JXR23_09865 [Pontiellaceae bacterium]|nr:hypothetical protein [Pontiellaceae bacterium]